VLGMSVVAYTIKQQKKRHTTLTKSSKNCRERVLSVGFIIKRIDECHELIDDHESNAKTSTQGYNLLTNGVAEGSCTRLVLIHELGNGGVRDNVAGTSDDITVQVTDNVDRDI
jgi:hypothetical protein